MSDKQKKIVNNSHAKVKTKKTIPKKIIKNQTSRRIDIRSKCFPDALIIPPFSQRTVDYDELENLDYARWERQNLICVEDETISMEKTAANIITLIFWTFVLGSVAGLLQQTLRNSKIYWIVFGGIIILALALCAITKMRYHLTWKIFRPVVHRFIEWIRQSFNLVLILAIGVGIPAVIIAFFGGLDGIMQQVDYSMSYGEPINSNVFPFLLGRILQLIFISILSLLPALLYFLFDRQQISSLRQDFFRDVIVLNSNITTLKDAETIYGKRIDQIYGSAEGLWGLGRILRGTRSPILLATLVITLGWLVTLRPIGTMADMVAVGELTIERFLIPEPMPLNFGLIGAYFFALNMTLSRYVIADLKPKAYSHITVRFFLVLILVWVVSIIPWFWNNGQPSPVLLIFLFFVGIVPETGMAIIQEFLQSQQWIGKRIPSMHEPHPLSRLQGINLYNRARLFEEGVENIENLVHSDLIDLMLQTRIPISRLVDWIDQGILYLHIVDTAESFSSNNKGRRASDQVPSALQKLHNYGIRTATDLQLVFESAEKHKDPEQAKELKEQVLQILENNRLRIILDAIKDDEWIPQVRNWRGIDRFQGPFDQIDEYPPK